MQITIAKFPIAFQMFCLNMDLKCSVGYVIPLDGRGKNNDVRIYTIAATLLVIVIKFLSIIICNNKMHDVKQFQSAPVESTALCLKDLLAIAWQIADGMVSSLSFATILE